MESLKAIYLAILAALLTGCGLLSSQNGSSAASSAIQSGALSGAVRTLSGEWVDLAAGSGRIQVVSFVSETCSVCRKETKGLVGDRSARGIPLNVDFLSIVVGATAEDAADWSSGLGVNWSVAIDPNDSLFRQYCPQLQTPCLLLRNPFLNQYKTLTGEHPISEWESFTGAWIY